VIEDLAVRRQGLDALLDPGAARVVESHDRNTALERVRQAFTDLHRVALADRTSADREVLREGQYRATRDVPAARDHAVRRHVLARQLVAAVLHPQPEFHEGVRIEQQVETFPRAELSLLVLLAQPVRAAARLQLLSELVELLESCRGHHFSTSTRDTASALAICRGLSVSFAEPCRFQLQR